ncbi:hypothetical protein [Saccharibacillus sp. O23]|uniref:hypothetical protein n=1 Tax=Saccharibacillus sp. O23 TaxID=2009338 RepID=UPI0015C5AB8F|nr:hypothetical protein [Saccharibacillus sp. O23]
MNRFKIPGAPSWMAATLAFGTLFGGIAALPSPGSTAYAASAESVSANTVTAERGALLKMLAMCQWASGDFYSDPANARYQAVKAASDHADVLLLDPDTSSSKLTASYNTLNSALDAYIADYIRDASILERQTFQMSRMLNASIGTTPGTYPQQAADAMFVVIDQAQAVAYDPNATVQQFREQYRKYVEGAAALRDSANFDRADRLSALNAQRQEIDALPASIPGDENYAKLSAAFDKQADRLEALLNDSSSGMLAVESAAHCVQTAYDALKEGGQLANELTEARKLMDSPKGIRSGQYPSSSFGELRKAINKSAAVLSKVSTQSQLTAARTSLAEAVVKFKSALRP